MINQMRLLGPLLLATVGAAVLMFAAQAVEYTDYKYQRLSAGLAFAGFLVTFVLTVLIIRAFRVAQPIGLAVVACLIGLMPFVLWEALRVNRTQLNVHGVGGTIILVYGWGSLLCCLSMLVGVTIRMIRAKARRGLISENVLDIERR